jgi:hypothetical protein
MGLLDSVRKGRNPRPPKVVIYGGPKVGKSTFGAGIPDAIFLQTEEGLDALDVHSFPLAQSFEDVLAALRTLAKEEHKYRALVVDSLDWLEPLIWDQVCKQNKVASIEEVGGGYGKGYIEAVKVWRTFLEALDYLRDNLRMTVVLIAHDEIRKFEPVDSEAYDYAALKLHKRAAAVVEGVGRRYCLCPHQDRGSVIRQGLWSTALAGFGAGRCARAPCWPEPCVRIRQPVRSARCSPSGMVSVSAGHPLCIYLTKG